MQIEESLDEKNTELYETLIQNNIQFDFIIDNNSESWKIQPVYKYKIVANNSQKSSSSLAHELLHVFCYAQGFLDTFTIIDIFNPNNSRFQTQNISIIQNLLGHLKMFPFFMKMGYKIEEFYLNQGDKLIKETLIPAFVSLGISYELTKAFQTKINIQDLTLFFQLVILIKQIEMEESYHQQNSFKSHEYKELLIKYDKLLFDCFYDELTKWVDSETFRNYDFYININEKLKDLGYPTESEITPPSL